MKIKDADIKMLKINRKLKNKNNLLISRFNNHIYNITMDNPVNNVIQIQNYTDREFYEKYDRINRILCNLTKLNP